MDFLLPEQIADFIYLSKLTSDYFSKQFYRKMPNDNKITTINGLLILVKIFFKYDFN
jgi:hypothetical protein